MKRTSSSVVQRTKTDIAQIGRKTPDRPKVCLKMEIVQVSERQQKRSHVLTAVVLSMAFGVLMMQQGLLLSPDVLSIYQQLH